MSEQAKRAEDLWQALRFAEDKVAVLAAALAQARREGVEGMRDAAMAEIEDAKNRIYAVAARLLAEGGKHA